MTILFDAFARKLFGARCRKLLQSLLICFMVFAGIGSAEYHLPIAPSVLFLMSAVFTGGVMWQALNASDTAGYIRNMVMMPFDNKSFAAAYIGTLAIHTIVTKTLLLWAVVFAVCKFDAVTIAGAVLSAVCGVGIISCIYAFRKVRVLCIAWAAGLIACIFFFAGNSILMAVIFAVNALIAAALLMKADGYLFYDLACECEAHSFKVRSHKNNLVWVYLMRYIRSHKNYMFNSLITWGFAAVIPWFLGAILQDSDIMGFFLYIGYGLVVINTPLCILVSCDRDLGRGIDCLPEGGRRFFIPYAGFLFASTCISYAFYLVSWTIKFGGTGVFHIVLAVVLAAVSAILSVTLEKFFPLTKWTIESELWHHPRKYVVPGAIIIISALIGSLILR